MCHRAHEITSHPLASSRSARARTFVVAEALTRLVKGQSCSRLNGEGNHAEAMDIANTASEFRDRARECRQSAAKATGLEKDEWLRLAEQWERIAKQTEKSANAFR